MAVTKDCSLLESYTVIFVSTVPTAFQGWEGCICWNWLLSNDCFWNEVFKICYCLAFDALHCCQTQIPFMCQCAAQQDWEKMTFWTKQTSLHWMWYFRARSNARKSDMVYDSQGGGNKQQDFWSYRHLYHFECSQINRLNRIWWRLSERWIYQDKILDCINNRIFSVFASLYSKLCINFII